MFFTNQGNPYGEKLRLEAEISRRHETDHEIGRFGSFQLPNHEDIKCRKSNYFKISKVQILTSSQEICIKKRPLHSLYFV